MGKKIIIGGLAGVLLLGGGAAGAYVFFGSEPEIVGEAAAETPAAEAEEPVYVEMQPLSAPVMRNKRVRYYIHMKVSLQVAGEEAKLKVYQHMPRLRDAFVRELHARSVTRGRDDQSVDFGTVKARLLAQSESVLGAGVVTDVLVTGAIGG